MVSIALTTRRQLAHGPCVEFALICTYLGAPEIVKKQKLAPSRAKLVNFLLSNVIHPPPYTRSQNASMKALLDNQLCPFVSHPNGSIFFTLRVISACCSSQDEAESTRGSAES